MGTLRRYPKGLMILLLLICSLSQLTFSVTETRWPSIEGYYSLGGVSYELLVTHSPHIFNYQSIYKTGDARAAGASLGIRVWVKHSDNTETEVTGGAPVAVVSLAESWGDYATGTWTPPATPMTSTDRIVVRFYGRFGSDPWQSPSDGFSHGEFATEPLSASQLDSVQWNIRYGYAFYYLSFGSTTYFEFRSSDDSPWSYGNTSIEGFSWTPVHGSQMTQSASPPSAQIVGYPVIFTCNYTDSANGSKIPGATVNVYINGTPYLATETATGYNFTHTFTNTGIYPWYCNGTDPSGTYGPAVAPSENYKITILYCNIAWVAAPTAPADFRTSPTAHYAHVVNSTATVAVNLTDASGNPVQGINVTINPAGFGLPSFNVTSDVNGIASTTFSLNTIIPRQYTPLDATSPICPGGVTVKPPDISTYVNAFHDAPLTIFISDPLSPYTIFRNPGQPFTISIEIRDQYNNTCNSSYDGPEYVTTNSSNKYLNTIAIRQEIYNATDTINYNALLCSLESNSSSLNSCFVFMKPGDEAKHTFNLLAYPWPSGVNWTGIRNTPEEVTLDSNFNPPTITPTGALSTTMILVKYTLPPIPPASGFKVILIPPQIKVGGNFTINVSAIAPNGKVDAAYPNTTWVSIDRAERKDVPPATPGALLKHIASIQLTNGTGSYFVNATGPASPNSLFDFNISGVYTITASDPAALTGKGYLSVSASEINHVDVVVNPLPVFRTLPFTANATIKDVAGNTVIGFSGQMNISCPPTTTDPPAQSVDLNSSSTAIFTQTANKTGTFICNITVFDSVAHVMITQPFTIIIVEALGCVNFSIPPNPIINPPVDNIAGTSDYPPVYDVMQHNNQIGGTLIGYDPVTKTMKGNYSICLESYYNGRACFNDSDIQFDKSPVSVCVKEFVYNPEADSKISDHINYNGVDNFEDTYKHPEVVWGWGYKAYDQTPSVCSGTTRYSVQFIPGTLYPDYFNMTVGLPLTVLQPYNITNDTMLNPHELRAPDALLVVDSRNNGRLAKFNMNAPATWLEDYTQSMQGSGAQAITYDNRGNIFIALSNMPKIVVLKLVRAYRPTLLFVKEINVVTTDGKSFLPYGLDTDSWGNLYVVGNTNPDQADNQMCVNVYDKNFILNQSNNCCDYGDCSNTWQGTVRDIAAQEDGAAIYIARGKHFTTNWGMTYYEGWPYIDQYNGSNVSQNLTPSPGISIFGQDGGVGLWTNNPLESMVDGPCMNQLGNSIVNANISDAGGWHYLRGLRFRRGYLFILDYMAPDHWAGCYTCDILHGSCTGCCIPYLPCWWYDSNNCNSCGGCNLYENQYTRILAMDFSNYPDKSYIARAIVEPNMSTGIERVHSGIPIAPGLQEPSNAYQTHGIDVDNNFNVFIALKGNNNAIVRYRFMPGQQDPTLNLPGVVTSSFNVINGWNQMTGTWTGQAYVTNNVTQPDDVIGYPDMIKESMMSGVSCEGCSLEGAVQPSVCQGQITQTNATSYSSLQDMLSGGKIAAGASAVHVTSLLNPVYRKNFISTNITASLRFDYTFKITPSLNDPACGGGAASSGPTVTIHKQLNLTSTSNNLTTLVEGGGTYFALTRPNYPEVPPTPPNTLPYLAYDYMTNRFFYKHYPLMDNVDSFMGPPASKEWMINASYRKTFQTMQNGYYTYQYIGTTPTVNDQGVQGAIYQPQGIWAFIGGSWKWTGDKDAPQYLNPTKTSPISPKGTIPFNNTMDWSYPFDFNFSPVTLEPNPLPFAPQDLPVAPAKPDYDYVAITNVSMLQLSIQCNTSTNIQVVYTKTITNTSYTDLGSCYTITAISITGATDEAYLFIVPLGLPAYNGICFESVYGANVSLCQTTRAWFRDSIQPNTVVAHTSIDKDIQVPTRYPLTGEPYASAPSSLFIVPIHMSGPTLMTINGVNNTPDYTNESKLSRIQGLADLRGTPLDNPLPLRGVDINGLYFRANDNLSMELETTNGLTTLVYSTTNGWIQIAGSGLPLTGDIERVKVTSGCEEGCLLQFANDSSGNIIAGQISLWKYNYAYGNASNGLKDPSVTYLPRRGGAQVVPADAMNRDFREIYSISGQGYLGDSFAVYVDPNLILGIDNLTAGNCTACTTNADCPNGVCNTGECEFPNVPKCKEAAHPSGAPCTESFVCPAIELSLLNESLEVSSDNGHDANNKTRVTVVGTDVSSNFKVINSTTNLISYTANTWQSLVGPFSDVYVVEVTGAIKGETLTFRTATTHTEVAKLTISSEDYVSKKSIGTILPNPRHLRISSDIPTMGRQIHYLIKGTIGNTVPQEEPGVGTMNPSCPLTGPSLIQPDSILNNCDLQVDPIQSPQPAGIPFTVRIRAVARGWIPHNIELFGYPSVSGEEDRNVCDSTPPLGLTTPPSDGQVTCLTTSPQGSVTPGYTAVKLYYPDWPFDWNALEARNLGGGASPLNDVYGVPDDIGGSIATVWVLGDTGIMLYKSGTPMNISALNVRVKTDGDQSLQVRMSTDPGCLPSLSGPSADPGADWDNADMKVISEYDFVPQHPNPAVYLDNTVNYTNRDGHKWDNVYCIGVAAPRVCYGTLCCCSQTFWIDTVGVYKDVWVPPVTPPPPSQPSFVAIKLNSPLTVTGFNVTAKNANAVNLSLPFTINMSDDPSCLTGNKYADSLPSHWKWSVPISLQATGSWKDNVIKPIGPYANVWCLAFDQPDPGVKWDIDSVGIFYSVPAVQPIDICNQFNGNVTLSDLDGMCPQTAGPFFNGAWSGDVIVPTIMTNDVIGATNLPASGTSNQFNVTAVPGLSLVSFDTQKAFTHVLAITIWGEPNEHFNITTTPLNLDEQYPLREKKPEQIGIITVLPNDFVLGFHQNISGTYLYSQKDSIQLNITDNKSLGLHDFLFPFYDRFNNTFLPNYTIWLRQPTSTTLDIQTVRDPSDINLTDVNVTAQLLFERYDKPDEKPSIPLPNQQIEIYVQNSSTSAYVPCTQAMAHCPNPALNLLYAEQSNCSCPDWYDEPGGTGNCIPNPNCHQYGKVGTFTTNATGQISTSFQIYGFGRRLAFAVFWGTDVYAPSIDIKPFYAGGVSIGMGSFSMLEPLLVVTISLALLTLERKFNKQKKKNI